MKTLGPVLGGLIVVALLVYVALRSQRVLETGLPPRIEHATQLTASGWVMSGLHNPRSESWEPITAAEFVGIIESVHVWKN